MTCPLSHPSDFIQFLHFLFFLFSIFLSLLFCNLPRLESWLVHGSPLSAECVMSKL
ncbi:hypothetical protein N657DRAFT_139219 [Parathielavia appendiculata]|uniref:Uncharacterized protein n=1 Tax=Parathielavia appendiculata TaxID=2587402 RepID=A0AAN6Z0R9_9PEZI|nr:hypothetical protein N657DRAFT_139219 [Parathielavia appendiculata]